MVAFHDDGDVSVELLVRRDLPRPSRRRADAIDAELRGLEAAGDIGEYRRQTWSKRVRVSSCDDDVRDRYLRFSAWATQAAVSLQPFFDTRERYDTSTESYSDCIVVPTMTLVVSVEGSVAAVYPHADGEGTATVEDGVEALERGDGVDTDESVLLAD